LNSTEHIVRISDHFGSFPADGSFGEEVRLSQIEPAWGRFERITLDFQGVSSMTDSFANAFIGNIVETHPEDFREKIRFRNCAPLARDLIKSAVGYAQRRLGRA
jgi:hypothetical protein